MGGAFKNTLIYILNYYWCILAYNEAKVFRVVVCSGLSVVVSSSLLAVSSYSGGFVIVHVVSVCLS